jgi:hypothetical protein
VEEKWDICDLFDSHEIMDVMQVIRDDENKKLEREMKRNK